jgi:hypothetical protein
LNRPELEKMKVSVLTAANRPPSIELKDLEALPPAEFELP